ncbi:cytochrome c oxidase subunit II [Salimicrobium flavidum]|uniref:Cytochrome c oxidase subunit 2 n=1 Tax=Salimicrobium flavidum TaxID=570947 RepID=A0A1N7JFB7_9BACI|nr:cytochrome c oxidase subunit II [Salimicrobium flavidum]SIS48027.1 cytochrome c oxidase subunit 2/cytochrome aa3-600 menaquinol oxidase subunit 2 [Salimicrobium flavidum]
MNKRIKMTPLFLLLILSACDLRVLDPASETGRTIGSLIELSFLLMMIVLITVFILFAVFMQKYRAKDYTCIPPDRKENKWFEVTWTVLPILLLVVLAIPAVQATYSLTYKSEAEKGDLEEEGTHIEVTAEQYSFTFTYPNGKESTNDLVLPVDREVTFTLTSEDVVHSFWIPELAGKIDAIPGKETHLQVTPDEVGQYQGKCAEFCGSYHAEMRFTTRVVEEEEFERWREE